MNSKTKMKKNNYETEFYVNPRKQKSTTTVVYTVVIIIKKPFWWNTYNYTSSPDFAERGLSNNWISLNDSFDLYASVVCTVCLCVINYYNIL